MDNETILTRVIELFATMTEAEEITADSEILEDLEISSMDVLYLISSLEEEFHISVPEQLVRKMVTVGDVADVIEQLLSAR